MAAVSAINNVDIADIIVQSVTHSRSELFTLALVSRSMSAAALDRLWRYLPTSFYILDLLPGFDVVEGNYCLMRNLEVNDWLAFDRYSYRIREINRLGLFSTSPADGITDIDPYTFQTLQCYRPGKPLFPSLRVFSMPRNLSHVVNRALVMMPFVTPTLRKLGIFATDASSASYLERLSSLSHNSQLKNIRIYGSSTFSSQAAVVKFRGLEYLDMNFHGPQDSSDINPDYNKFLDQLSTLEHLASLLLHLPLSIFPTTLSTTGFLQLRRLALTGSVMAFEALCPMVPRIEYLVLEALYPEHHESWKRLFRIIQNSCPSLSSLFFCGYFFIDDAPLRIIQLIDPLLHLPLQSLVLRSQLPIVVELSDSDIMDITKAWPNLLNMEVFIDGRYNSPNIPTMDGVKSFLRECEGLQYLRMSCWNKPIDMSTHERRFSKITFNNTYPPFIKFG